MESVNTPKFAYFCTGLRAQSTGWEENQPQMSVFTCDWIKIPQKFSKNLRKNGRDSINKRRALCYNNHN